MIVEPKYCEKCNSRLLAAPVDAADDPEPPFCDDCRTAILQKENPYIETEKVIKILKFNPYYGDNRVCECGHIYYRHFDTYEDMEPVGCKYCHCFTFVEGSQDG